MASSATPAQPSSSHTADRCSLVPVHSQTLPPQFHRDPCLLDIAAWLLSGRDLLRQHHFPETVVEMATDPLRDLSSNVYNSQWKAFAKWANDKGIQSFRMAEYLAHHFAENKQVNTLKVHRSSIASVLKMLNMPTAIQEDTIHNIIRWVSILRPRTQEILPKWRLGVVLKGLMKPPFAAKWSDKNTSLELLSYKTAFLVALATVIRDRKTDSGLESMWHSDSLVFDSCTFRYSKLQLAM